MLWRQLIFHWNLSGHLEVGSGTLPSKTVLRRGDRLQYCRCKGKLDAFHCTHQLGPSQFGFKERLKIALPKAEAGNARLDKVRGRRRVVSGSSLAHIDDRAVQHVSVDFERGFQCRRPPALHKLHVPATPRPVLVRQPMAPTSDSTSKRERENSGRGK
jgi:hypothetical protein